MHISFRSSIINRQICKGGQMESDPNKLIAQHNALIHSENKLVISHTQREISGELFQNTLMIEGCDSPFKYRRPKKYKPLTGQKVNLTFYPASEMIAGASFEVMQVVRLRRN